jgi:hypothetical protein
MIIVEFAVAAVATGALGIRFAFRRGKRVGE